MENKTKFGKILSKELNESTGEMTAIVSVFGNVDLAGETVVFGAFAKSLKNKLPKLVWMHDWTKPIGIITDAIELESGNTLLPDSIKDFGGLLVKCKFNLELTPANTPANTDAYRAWSDLKQGAIDEFSIGYEVKQSAVKDGVRLLTELNLIEASPVLVGANQATVLMDIKAMDFNTHIQTAGQAVSDAVNRVIERNEVRVKAGRTFSQNNYNALSQFAETVIEAGKSIKDLLKSGTEKTLTEQEQTNALARIKIMNLKHKGLIK